MTFLRSHNLPAAACFVLRYLASQPTGVTEPHFPGLLAPPSLDGPAPKDRKGAGGFATDHTIQSLRSIRLIDVEESRLSIAEGWRAVIESATSNREVFQVIRRAVFASTESVSTWTQPNQRGWDSTGANDFLRVACWLLAQNPLGPPLAFDPKRQAASAERLQRQQFKEGRARLFNQTSWDDFIRWACALGLARRIQWKETLYVTPDPTDAIAEELAMSLEQGRWYSVGEVLTALTRSLPIIGQGMLRSQMLPHLRAAPESVVGRTEDAALSQAIITLADNNVIEFKGFSDATDQRMLWDRPDHRSITELRLVN